MFGPVVPRALADGRSVGLFEISLASLLIAPDGKMFVSEGDAIGGPEIDPIGCEEHPVRGEEQPTIAISTAATQSIEESSIVPTRICVPPLANNLEDMPLPVNRRLADLS